MDVWSFTINGFNPDDIVTNGNRFLVANGYMGYRGTMDEWGRPEMAAVNLAGVYDRNGDKWREPVNAPNGLFARLYVNGEAVALGAGAASGLGEAVGSGAASGSGEALGSGAAVEHSQCIHFRRAVHSRDTQFKPARIQSERFASMAEPHLLVSRLTLTFAEDCDAELVIGIDTDIWDINGPHLFDYSYQTGAVIHALAYTGELRTPVVVAQATHYGFECDERQEIKDTGVYRHIGFRAKNGATYSVTIYSSVYTGQDCMDIRQGDQQPIAGVLRDLRDSLQIRQENPQIVHDSSEPDFQSFEPISRSFVPLRDASTLVHCAATLCSSAAEVGYDSLLASHEAAWETIWWDSAVELCGCDDAAQALNASLYHLHSIAPRHLSALSIPARGLSGQTYKGAIFWDSEIFLFPVFVHTEPELAGSLLRYRIQTLPGALRKAAGYGYRGAFYPWESQEGGAEGCTDYNVVDVFTHRPVRTYFRDKQIHISGDIVYAIWQYYKITGDVQLLRDGGAEVIMQCARFYLSRAHRRVDSDKVELLDVIGPDEYHERVSNNTFTNVMAAYCMSCALALEGALEESDRGFFMDLVKRLEYDEDLRLLRDVYPRLNPVFAEGEVIEQFDGYFGLEDCSLSDVRGRLLDKREYWGTNHGVAAHTQIIKQADVISMMALFPSRFSDITVERNWDFYEPRTEHGSSLSACMYALTACRIGRPDLAWEHFLKTASIDLIGGGKHWAGEIYIGGTHPAANGGAWMIAVLGFAGLSVLDGDITLKPQLPAQIKALRFPVQVRGIRSVITVTHDGWDITRE